jgi:hypothetical protein
MTKNWKLPFLVPNEGQFLNIKSLNLRIEQSSNSVQNFNSVEIFLISLICLVVEILIDKSSFELIFLTALKSSITL